MLSSSFTTQPLFFFPAPFSISSSHGPDNMVLTVKNTTFLLSFSGLSEKSCGAVTCQRRPSWSIFLSGLQQSLRGRHEVTTERKQVGLQWGLITEDKAREVELKTKH